MHETIVSQYRRIYTSVLRDYKPSTIPFSPAIFLMGHHRPEPAIKNFRLQGRSENELASAEYFSAEASSLHALHAVARIGRKKSL